MADERYMVRRGNHEFGPWSLAQVRRFILTCEDPEPDYDLREAKGGAWVRASSLDGLADLFDSIDVIEPLDSMTVRTTERASPQAKRKKA